MAWRPDTATPDRQSRVLLVAVVAVAVVVFLWLVVTLASAAFG